MSDQNSSPSSPFAFEMRQRVKLSESNEEGAIIARAEYSYMTPQYLVRYRNGAGNQIENWWPAEAIVAV